MSDRQQIEPKLEKLGQLPDALGEAEALLTDKGYFQRGQCRGLRPSTPRTADRQS